MTKRLPVPIAADGSGKSVKVRPIDGIQIPPAPRIIENQLQVIPGIGNILTGYGSIIQNSTSSGWNCIFVRRNIESVVCIPRPRIRGWAEYCARHIFQPKLLIQFPFFDELPETERVDAPCGLRVCPGSGSVRRLAGNLELNPVMDP